jgi:ankyrin repeat protein
MMIEKPNRDGWTAAHFAGSAGSLTILECRRQAGHFLTAKNGANGTPLPYAFKYRHKTCIDYLIHECGISVPDSDQIAGFVHITAAANDKMIVQMLFENGMGFKYRNHNGWNFDDYAAANGNSDVMQIIVDSLTENDLGMTDRAQRPPLMLAAMNGHLHIITLLSHLGFDLYSAVDKFGKTVFHYAAEFGHRETVSFLLKKYP